MVFLPLLYSIRDSVNSPIEVEAIIQGSVDYGPYGSILDELI